MISLSKAKQRGEFQLLKKSQLGFNFGNFGIHGNFGIYGPPRRGNPRQVTDCSIQVPRVAALLPLSFRASMNAAKE